jgi:protease-4
MKPTRVLLIVVAVAGLAILAWAGASPERPVGAGSRPTATSSPTTSSQPARANRPRGAAKPKAGRDSAPPTIAHIRLDGDVLESPPGLLWLPDDHYMTLQDWLQRLAKARQDKAVTAVALDIDGPCLSWAQAQELADAVARLSAVKPVYAFLNSPCAADHLVASACREVALDPSDTLMIPGVGVEMLYFRGTLDKLGLTPQFVQIGSYKGASEPFSQTQPSAQVKEQYGWLLDDLYDQLLGQLVQHRRLTREQAREAVDAGILSAAEAKRLHLVDRVVEKADWEAAVEDRVAPRDQDVYWEDDYGCKKEKALDLSNPFAMLGTLLRGQKAEERRDPTIAIVCAEGVIASCSDDGEDLFGGSVISAASLTRIFADLERDDRVKAVIFRIDSPGGSALASEHIYQAVRRCAEAKPVIVSIGALGASGGYYIACGGTTILADPASLVGSIGVVSGKIALTGLLDKIGVSRFELTRGAKAGLEMLRPWTKEEEAVIRKHAQLTYETFLQRVKDSRGRKVPKVEEVAGGRVFTARQAKDKGLVDQIGGLRDAVLQAQEAAGLKEAHFITLPRPRSILDILMGGGEQAAAQAGGSPSARRAISAAMDPSAAVLRKLAGRRERAAASYLLSLTRLLGREKVLAAMPGYLDIHW